MWLAFVSMVAGAGEWRVESDPVTTQTGLESARLAVQKAGFDAAIVPRYAEHGVWMYVMEVDGFSDPASARTAASALAERTGLRMAIVDQTTSAMLDQVTPPAGLSAQDVLGTVVKAHGGDAASLERARQGPLRFEFRRTLPNGMIVDHLWEARGDDRYCRIEVVAGKGRSSAARIVGGVAEMSVEGGPWERQDAAELRAVVEALGPAEVIPVIFGLHPGTPARPDMSQLQLAGDARAGDVEVTVLRFAGDKTAPAVELLVGAHDHLLRLVNWQGGAVVHELADYRAVGGLRVPFEVRTARVDGVGDLVEVKSLQFGGALDEAHFRLATDGKPR